MATLEMVREQSVVASRGERMTGAHALLRALLYQGVDTIFGYPGGAIMPTYDALYDYGDRIRHILVRHEQGAAHMAEGYTEMRGKVGVVLVTSGPGATNCVTGLADALMDSRPMVVISGQVARPMIKTQAFQEAPVTDITQPVTKWNYLVQSASEIPTVVARAFSIAKGGRPGPVLIDIPKDVQNEETEYYPNLKNGPIGEPSLSSETLRLLDQGADLLNLSQKPLILAGHGILISGAMPELRALAEKAGIPVANTLHGLSSFPTKHDLFVGMLGMHGRYGSNKLTNEADVILAVGMRFDDRVTGKLTQYARQARIIHIDIDPTQLNRLVKAEIAIKADAKQALAVLLEKVIPNQHRDWLARFRQLDEIEDEQVTQKVLSPDNPSLTMAAVIHMLSVKTNGEAVVVADVGQHQMVAAQRYGFSRPHSFITSGGMGTMGFALPAAIGAKVAAPEREVVAVIGDGSFQMTMQELGTIMQERLPVKIVILNNEYLGMVRQWQDLFHQGRRSFVDMKNPDFVTLAAAYGIPGRKVDCRQDLDYALNRLLSAQGAYLLDIRVQKEENVFPMIPAGAAVDEIRLN